MRTGLETPKELAASVALRFKQLRRRKKISVRELSLRSGVGNSTIRRFEATGEIAFLSLIKIASVLNEEEELADLFSRVKPASIEEVIHGAG